jgi:hypothetical protein
VESAVYTSDQQTAALDISRYNGGDLFVTVDVADASALTTTIQYSADGENYADCYWLSAERRRDVRDEHMPDDPDGGRDGVYTRGNRRPVGGVWTWM